MPTKASTTFSENVNHMLVIYVVAESQIGIRNLGFRVRILESSAMDHAVVFFLLFSLELIFMSCMNVCVCRYDAVTCELRCLPNFL